MRTLTVLTLVAAIANVASAAITMEIIEVDNSSQLTGYVTQDIVVTTDTDWLSAHLIVQPDASGSIYQYDYGDPWGYGPAFQIWPPPFPAAEFDTYVSSGVQGESVSMTGAVDLGEGPNVIFDTSKLSITWWVDSTDDIGTLGLARVTLADNATGTWQFLATAAPAEGPRVEASGPIVDGYLVPEPAMLSLLALGAMALIRRRRLPAE